MGLFNFWKPRDELVYGGVPRSSKWPKVRAAFIKAHPVCAVCGCKTNLSVHHIQPYHLVPSLELEENNLITLGEQCATGNHHLLFGHLGNWLSYNICVRSDASIFATKIQERP